MAATYNGKHTFKSKDPVTADHPKRQPQLMVKPK